MNFKSLVVIVFLVASFSSFAAPECGLKGSIEDRIRDCSHAQKEYFVLVTRIKMRTQTFEVYKDMRTNLLWSDSLYPNELNYVNGLRACENYIREEMGNIADVNWELPTVNMYREAERSGIKTALPNMKAFFWTVTVNRDDPKSAYMFNGVLGDISTYTMDYGSARVRCVAQTY